MQASGLHQESMTINNLSMFISLQQTLHMSLYKRMGERKQKGGFVTVRFGECTLVPIFGTEEHPNVPSFRVLVPGNVHMYPRSVFFGTGEHPPKPPFWKPPFFRRDYQQNFVQPDFRAEKRKGPLWRFSAYLPVMRA